MVYTECVKEFNQLTTLELYKILHARNEVFVVEQDCVYQDLDFIDQKSHHIWLESKDGEIAGYLRFYLDVDGVVIGRVLTTTNYRKQGLGKVLMRKTLEEIKTVYPNSAIQMSAQNYLRRFYNEFGFAVSGDVYLEDGIDHIKMVKKAV